jgi:peptidyl-prolyl cis-trans isomerase A (cyclophilin A)
MAIYLEGSDLWVFLAPIFPLISLTFGVGEDKPAPVHVLIQTEKGDIEVELNAAQAPITVGNFVKYVDGKFYNGGRFHRIVKPDNQPDNKVKIEVIQAGINPDKVKEEFKPIKLERTRDTKMSHKDGTISMARDEPDTATSDFFICIGDQPELDFGGKRNPDGQGFAAFGRVVKGMDVVKKIQAAPAEEQKLSPPVIILKTAGVTTTTSNCGVSPRRGSGMLSLKRSATASRPNGMVY